MKVRVIGRIDSGEDTATVAENVNVNVNTVAAWWNRREKILKKSKLANLSTSKVFTSLDDSTVKVTHEDEINKSSAQNRSVNLDQSEVFTKCLEVVSLVKSDVKDSCEEKHHMRGRRLNLSNNSQPSPIPNGRLYMPLEVKQSAIRRIEEGATQVVVARDLDMSLSTVASWWRKKDMILQNLTSAEDKKLNHLATMKEKEPKTTVLNDVPKQKIDTDAIANLSHTDEILSSTHIAPGEAFKEILPSESNNEPEIDLAQSSQFDGKIEPQEKIDNVETELVNKTEDKRDISAGENKEQNNLEMIELNCWTSEDISSSNIHKDIKSHKSVDQSGLFSSMKSAFNGIDCDHVEIGTEKDQTSETMTTFELSNTEVSNPNIKNASESIIPGLKNSSSSSNGEVKPSKEILENTSETINGNYEHAPVSSVQQQTNKSRPSTKNHSLSFNEGVKNTPETFQETVIGPSDSKHEVQHMKNILSTEHINSVTARNGILKPSHLQEVDCVIKSVENVITGKVNAVHVEHRLETISPPLVDDVALSRTSTPIPDNPNPSSLIAIQNDNRAGKVIKKKSLDFLANSLMKKALARSQIQLTPVPPKPSQSLSSSSHCQIVQESHVLSKTHKVQITPPPLPPPPVPQSGLGLIVSSYCSSEDEL